MPLVCGIGFSQHPDPVVASKNAAGQALQSLDQTRIDLAFVWNTVHYDPAAFLPGIYETLDQTKLIGCSTAGIIFPDRVETRGIAVLAIHSEDVKFEISAEDHLNFQDLTAAGKTLAKNCMTDFGQQHRKLFFFLADGLLPNISFVVKGIQSRLGENFCIAGAGSSDNFRYHKTYQYYKNKIMSKGIAGILLGGRVHFSMGIAHGWHPLGKPRKITRINNNAIQSIDGKNAVDFYEDFFPRKTILMKDNPMGQINIRYPLGMPIGYGNDYLLRNVLTTLDDGSIICQDTFDPSREIHFMMTNADSCIRAAERVARDIKEDMHAIRIVLLFESAARCRLLGRNVHKELAAIQRILGPVPLVGIYTYGETHSYRLEKNSIRPMVQNNSIMMLALD